MASKQGYCADLKNYVEKRLEILLNGKRTIVGRLRGYDQFMNLVMEDCSEVTFKGTAAKGNNSFITIAVGHTDDIKLKVKITSKNKTFCPQDIEVFTE